MAAGASEATTRQSAAAARMPGSVRPGSRAPTAAPTAPVSGGSVHQQAPHPSPAATPEPMTMLLVGIGAAALYRMRRYLV